MTKQAEVGRAIRRARVASGLSLRRTASLLAVSPATLSAIENGRTPLTVGRLQQIANLLGVPAGQLLKGESETVIPIDAQTAGDWRSFDGIELDPILEAATGLFVQLGFHASSMREVAVEAGLSVAGIYHHYPSKQQILVALLDVTMAEIRWRMTAAKEDGATAVESFALMVEALALFHAVRGDLAFVGASEMRSLAGPELERVVGLRNGVQYALDDQATVCLETGEFTSEDPHTASRAIASMCTSLPGWFRPGGPLTPAEVAERYADYALALMGFSSKGRKFASRPDALREEGIA